MNSILNGWLVLDKPVGVSSTGLLNQIKKLIQANKNHIKVGHAGTLDPEASGILLVAFGEATKTVEYAMGSRKAYDFTLTWGEDRSTDDSEGEIIATSDVRAGDKEVKNIIKEFIGKINQVPPKFSAIKVQGERAYNISRQGGEVELKPREVMCYSAELLTHNQSKSQFSIECGKGFYIRSLARDIAHALGTCGYVSELKRTRLGQFRLEDAISLDCLKELVYTSGLEGVAGILKPVHVVLDGILVQQVTLSDARKLQQGQKVKYISSITNEEKLAAMFENKIVAICKVSEGLIIPSKVFNLLK